MFSYEPDLSPPCDYWTEYKLPFLSRMKIVDICNDILKRGDQTVYQAIYDAIYEMVEADIESGEEHD